MVGMVGHGGRVGLLRQRSYNIISPHIDKKPLRFGECLLAGRQTQFTELNLRLAETTLVHVAVRTSSKNAAAVRYSLTGWIPSIDALHARTP